MKWLRMLLFSLTIVWCFNGVFGPALASNVSDRDKTIHSSNLDGRKWGVVLSHVVEKIERKVVSAVQKNDTLMGVEKSFDSAEDKWVSRLKKDIFELKTDLKKDQHEITQGCLMKADSLNHVLGCLRHLTEAVADLFVDLECGIIDIKNDIMLKNFSKKSLPCVMIEILKKCNEGEKVSEWFREIPVFENDSQFSLSELGIENSVRKGVSFIDDYVLTKKQCRVLRDVLSVSLLLK